MSIGPGDKLSDPRLLLGQIEFGEHQRVDIRRQCRRPVRHEKLVDRPSVVVDKDPHRRFQHRSPAQRRLHTADREGEQQFVVSSPRQPPCQSAIDVDLALMTPNNQGQMLTVGEERRGLRQGLRGLEPSQIVTERTGKIGGRASTEQLTSPKHRCCIHPHGYVPGVPPARTDPNGSPIGTLVGRLSRARANSSVRYRTTAPNHGRRLGRSRSSRHLRAADERAAAAAGPRRIDRRREPATKSSVRVGVGRQYGACPWSYRAAPAVISVSICSSAA